MRQADEHYLVKRRPSPQSTENSSSAVGRAARLEHEKQDTNIPRQANALVVNSDSNDLLNLMLARMESLAAAQEVITRRLAQQDAQAAIDLENDHLTGKVKGSCNITATVSSEITSSKFWIRFTVRYLLKQKISKLL